jgi:type III secretion protein L
MAFFLPHHPLTPRHTLALDVDPAQRIVRAPELAAWRDADAAVAAARAQAEAIVSGAQAAFEAECQRGHAEGLAQARRESAEHMTQQVARADAFFTQVEERLVALVVQAVRRIVGGYSDGERALHAVRNALAVMRNQKQLTLRVHPDQLEQVKARSAELRADFPVVELLDVVPDARLAADACVLESEIGVVEAGTEGQLAALEAAFRRAGGSGGADGSSAGGA